MKRVTCLVSLGLILACVHCSSDEFESATGKPDAGDGGGGDAGAAGDSGNPDAVACSTSDECDDHDACTGDETCENGTCQPGVPVACQAPEHCTSTCVDNAGTASCQVSAADVDQDQHGDIGCVDDPGDDCDDNEPLAHPGATEECDGIDNDCDGKDDLKDGASLAGSPGPLFASSAEAYEPSVAWTDAGSYGVAFTGTAEGGERVYFLRMTTDGMKLADPVKLSTANVAAHTPRIAASATEFGVVWDDGQTRFQLVNAVTGLPVGAPIAITQAPSTLLATSPSIVRGTNGWIISYTSKDATGIEMRANTLDDSGALGTEITLSTLKTTNPSFLDAALVGNTLGVAWEYSPPAQPNRVVFFGRASVAPSFGALGVAPLTPNPPPTSIANTSPRIGASGGAFAVAWRHQASPDSGLEFSIRDEDGNALCGPVVLPNSEPSELQAVIGQKLGPMALTVDDQNTLSLQRLSPSCEFVDAQVVTASEIIPSNPRAAAIARGAQGYAVVWSREETGGGIRYLSRRVFGANLCD